MFDVYFFGKFSVNGKYQEIPDSQSPVFKQMYKELKKSKYTEAVMFKRLDNQSIYYSRIQTVSPGKYFGIGIVRDASFDRFIDLCSCFEDIYNKLEAENLIRNKEYHLRLIFKDCFYNCFNFTKRRTEIGLFLSNLQPWRSPSSPLTPLAGSVGIDECIVRECACFLSDLSFKNPDLLRTYTQLLEKGYPNFFVGYQGYNGFMII